MRGGPSITGRQVRAWNALRRFVTPPRQGGFTVVEVIIVLAISGGLFVSAVIMISGRQNRTAFDQATRQVQSQVQQVLNEVTTGYFPNNGNFSCDAGAVPDLDAGGAAQGTNSGCIFLGKVLQFKVAGTDPERFAVYTIAGLKKSSTGGEPASLDDAKPVLVARSSLTHTAPTYPDNSSEERLQNGLTVSRMWYRDGAGVDHDTGAVAFVNALAEYGGSGELLSGSGSVNIVAADNSVGSTGLNLPKAEMVEALNADGGNKLASGVVNPAGGVFICFESGGTEDYAVVQIGGRGRDLTVTLVVIDKTGPTCSYTP